MPFHPARLALHVGRPVVLALAFLATACGGSSSPPAGAQASDEDAARVLATIGDDTLRLEDLGPAVGNDLARLDLQYRRARSTLIENALSGALSDRLLAAEAEKQGVSVDRLIAAELPDGADPSPQEVSSWYAENQGRLGGRSLDEVRPQIAQHLRQQRILEASQRLVARLHAEHDVAIHFTSFRLDFDNRGAPALGPADAPVTLVEFSDFQCPFCARFARTLHQLHQEFPDDVRIVFRQFPITSIHPGAFKAAEASLCAHEQGRFWQFHDAMFLQQNRLDVSDLRALARQTGLDHARFDTCLDSGRYVEQVQKDLREGERVGITGTPAVFINGVPLPGGAVPFDAVASAVRAELARARPDGR